MIGITFRDNVNGTTTTRTWFATDPCGNIDSCKQSITKTVCNFNIFHTGTTCADFKANKPGTPLYEVCYKYNGNGKIGIVTPGVFFYYTYITAPSATFTMNIIQSNSCGIKNFDIHQNQILLFDSATCVRKHGLTINSMNGQATVTITGAIPGTRYVISVKYDSKSIQGATLGAGNDTCQYQFVSKIGSTVVVGSQGSVNLVPNCSATSAPAFVSEEIEPQFLITQKQASKEGAPEWKVYPNPVTQFLTISGNGKLRTVEVITLEGRILKQFTSLDAYQLEIDMSEFAEGMYLLRLNDRNGNIETRPLMKM